MPGRGGGIRTGWSGFVQANQRLPEHLPRPEQHHLLPVVALDEEVVAQRLSERLRLGRRGVAVPPQPGVVAQSVLTVWWA